jgi:hypothetical protein
MSISKERGIIRVKTYEDYGIAIVSVSQRSCDLGAPLIT